MAMLVVTMRLRDHPMPKVVDKDTPGAKYSELEYEVLDVMDTDEGTLTYVLVELITGRHHQIRAQFAKRKMWNLG